MNEDYLLKIGEVIIFLMATYIITFSYLQCP